MQKNPKSRSKVKEAGMESRQGEIEQFGIGW